MTERITAKEAAVMCLNSGLGTEETVRLLAAQDIDEDGFIRQPGTGKGMPGLIRRMAGNAGRKGSREPLPRGQETACRQCGNAWKTSAGLRIPQAGYLCPACAGKMRKEAAGWGKHC